MEKRKKGANRVVYHRRLLNHFRETDAENNLLSFEIPNASKICTHFFIVCSKHCTSRQTLLTLFFHNLTDQWHMRLALCANSGRSVATLWQMLAMRTDDKAFCITLGTAFSTLVIFKATYVNPRCIFQFKLFQKFTNKRWQCYLNGYKWQISPVEIRVTVKLVLELVTLTK